MHWKLSAKILIFCMVADISLASDYSKHNDSYRCRLGSKTPYRCIANYDESTLEYPDCVEKKIWLIFRHGTRYPGKKYIPRMIEDLPELQHVILKNYENGATNLSADEAALFKKWKLTFTQGNMMKLAVEGENEMIDLGERYQARFPSLMPEAFNNQTYKFRFTATQRTEESARHFAVGLFGWHNSKNVWYPLPVYRDRVIRFYKACPRWRQEVDKNLDAKLEKTKFLDSKIVRNMLDNIKKRIGLNIDYETVNLMYTTCAFETALNQSIISPWCKIFSSNDFKIFEYVEDLEFYWIDGYGYPLTYEQACAVLKDMFDFFGSNEVAVTTAYFTHSGTILKLIALLGLAKDAHPLTHDSFVLRKKEDKRAWRSSIIDTFATNMAFILYDCEYYGPSVLFMLQERPVYLPGCPKDMPCPLNIMRAIYPDRDEECQFDAMCHITKQDN
ncbi:PREDICTED: multiple inositol polyphosphate phosphatase 1 [Trachymyrmex cornetzi]|uniref:Multiple inositol polyphosphate phosphatase 1 n=1 Tax=Trachymyrmex cornetzi TaxID=471704 RepID=A0A151JM62_9HYME|nr:PREDICTED: multiple inositol polyphosphate phosphatase 1 [Trachymyrmex cornetzi]KYN27390.1 Multiple inositol polyphosphate phosphatase 1 [Trachymyrmex cornetzi]